MFLVIDITATPEPMTRGFDICRDFKWLAIGSFVLYYSAAFVVYFVKGGNVNRHVLHFYLFHAIFVPIVVFAVVWTYQHPEQIENNPDGWMSDLRPIWPIFAVIDLCFIAKFRSGREARRQAECQAQAARYMRIANECLAEGKHAEAEYAYQKGKWILENKCKGR